MNNIELEELLKDYSVKVCCADQLPSFIKKKPQSFVVNTDPCSERGSHWTVFHFPKKGAGEFFDSLGERPETYHRRFRNVLIINGPTYLYTTDRMQPEGSNTCGMYCVHFIRSRYRHITYQNILKDFSRTDLRGNDRVVKKFIRAGD